MFNKKQARVRRSTKTRMKIRDGSLSRLSVQRTPKHIYAQITSPKGDRTLVSASTLETSIRSGATGNKNAASEVGKLIAERAISVGIKDVSFDRSGYKFKALNSVAYKKMGNKTFDFIHFRKVNISSSKIRNF